MCIRDSDRDREIESFQKSKYYKLIAPFLTEEGEAVEALYMEKDSEKFEDQSYPVSYTHLDVYKRQGLGCA